MTEIPKLEWVAQQLAKAKSVFVITGAGMSAESGLPTYRGVGGLYDDKKTEDGIPIETALSGSMFRTRPEITWKYLSQIEKSTRNASFNRGHQVLAEMEKQFDRFWILTQNIDGYHSAAGSENVIEIHGNMNRLKCTCCERQFAKEEFQEVNLPPLCHECGGMVRPMVVLFDEQLPKLAINTLYRELEKPFDVVMTIGTSSYFPYIVQPVVYAKQTGVFTVEINPGETELSDVVDVKLSLKAAEALDNIWSKIPRSN